MIVTINDFYLDKVNEILLKEILILKISRCFSDCAIPLFAKRSRIIRIIDNNFLSYLSFVKLES